MFAIDLYESTFELRDKGVALSPITYCTFNASTQWCKDDEMDKVVNTLLEMKVPESTRMSIVELLQLPRHILHSLVLTLRRHATEREAKLAEMEAERERLNGESEGKKNRKKRR